MSDKADVIVKDLGITIAALRVDGKQMSLAMFRQLPIWTGRDLVGATVLGFVRYHIRLEGESWIVAIVDKTLYRCKSEGYPNRNFSQLFIAV